jgi:dTDP-4-amino-4,6-dideoxygalactose transaminase
MNPHQVTKDFEAALCSYTGAPFAVAVNSCTMALLLAVAWHEYLRGYTWLRNRDARVLLDDFRPVPPLKKMEVEIPKRTYVSVPQSIIHAGAKPTFRDEDWVGMYDLRPLHIFDSARLFTEGMWNFPPQGVGRPITPTSGYMMCTSFHASKTLGDSQGGAILHDNPEADAWLRRARFDGRTEGVAPKDDRFDSVGWHCYMSPDVAARLLHKLSVLPRYNAPLPNDDYPDLSQLEVFK